MAINDKGQIAGHGTVNGQIHAYLLTPVADQTPTIASFSPPSAAAGGSAIALSVTGSNFAPGATVRWNGSARPTTVISATRLIAQIAAADLAAAGTARVTVVNPGGAISNAQTFTIEPSQETRAIIYIQGVNSSSACDGGGFVARDGAPSWLNPYLQQQAWIKSKVAIGRTAYFSYSGKYCDGGTGENGATPDYTDGTTCFGLDEVYYQSLRGLIARITDAQPGTKVTLIGHSQGGLIAAYTVGQLLRDDPDFVRRRIASVVTFDSFPGGLPDVWLRDNVYQIVTKGPCSAALAPNHEDWASSSQVATVARDAAREVNSYKVQFYTLHADKLGSIPDLYTHISGENAHAVVDGRDHSSIWSHETGTAAELAGCAIIRCSLLGLSADGGAVVASPPAAAGRYDVGVQVRLTAAPTSPNVFLGWIVDGRAAGAGAQLDLTLSVSHTATAQFGLPLRINLLGTGAGIVDVSRVGNRATIIALPSAGFLFLGWRVSGSTIIHAQEVGPVDSWLNPLTIDLTADTTVTPVFAPRPSFPDVTPATTGATEPIAQLAARGIVKGREDGTFGPTDPTLRAQMAALIVRAMGWTGESAANPFTDRDGVDDELWRAVAILAQHGVAKGYGGGLYGTTDDVLNAQVVSFVTRAMVNKGYWQFQPDNPAIYPNVAADSGHRVDLVTYAHYAGAVRGAADPTADFAGWDQPASRAWFAFALWQALDSTFGR